MPIIKSENLLAIKNENGIFCLVCADNHESENENEAITASDIEDDEILICDCCNEILYKG